MQNLFKETLLTLEMPIANGYEARFVKMQYFPALFYGNAVYHVSQGLKNLWQYWIPKLYQTVLA